MIVFDCLKDQKLWRRWDGTSAECGTFSPEETRGRISTWPEVKSRLREKGECKGDQNFTLAHESDDRATNSLWLFLIAWKIRSSGAGGTALPQNVVLFPLAALPKRISTKSNIDKWFETNLTAEANQTDSNKFMIVFDCLKDQKLWRRWDGTSAECGTFSPEETQHGSPEKNFYQE
jgi:hypothetical protein